MPMAFLPTTSSLLVARKVERECDPHIFCLVLCYSTEFELNPYENEVQTQHTESGRIWEHDHRPCKIDAVFVVCTRFVPGIPGTFNVVLAPHHTSFPIRR